MYEARADLREAVVQEFVDAYRTGLADVKTGVHPLFELVAASYAYWFSHRGDSRFPFLSMEFPFAVAHQEICLIKALKTGLVATTRDYDDFRLIHGSLVKASQNSCQS